MKLLQLKLAISIILVVDGIGTVGAQDAVEKLQPLVTTSAHRLAIAKQVAFAKWDSQAPVEDAASRGTAHRGRSRGWWPVQYLRAAPEGSQARVPVDLKNFEFYFEEQRAIPER